MKRLTLSLFLSCAFIVFAGCGGAAARDYLIVLDTSGSMQERNTFKRVHDAMPKILETVKKGDSVTLMHFDQDAIVDGTVQVNGPEDHKQIMKLLDGMKPFGPWTDMVKMLTAVRERVKIMKDQGKIAHIIVLSDGLDDPRPTAGRQRGAVDIGKFRDPEPGPVKDAFIYYISLGEISNPLLEEQLKKVSPQTTTYLAGNRNQPTGPAGQKPGQQGTPEEALSQVGKDVQKNNWLTYVKMFGPYVLGVILLVVLIWLLVLLIRRLSRGDKLYGSILYFPEGIQFPNRNTFTLNKLGSGNLTIGARQGSRLRIKDLGTTELFSFKGKKAGPNLCLRPLGKTARNIQFASQRQQGLISPGDRFRIGEYSFVFNDEES